MRAAVPLAILAGCQVLTMLTGGIDLSVGAVASMSGFLVATLSRASGSWSRPSPSLTAALGGPPQRRRRRRVPGPPADHVAGHEPGRPRVRERLAAHASRPAAVCRRFRWARLRADARVPALQPPVFVPLAAVILLGLRRTAYGRLLFAIGDNPIAARLSGARSWQVLLVLYVISALIAAIAGFLHLGLANVASVTLADSSSCHRWPPRSSAGPRSSAAAAATPGRSSARSS